MSTANGEDIQ